MREDAGKNGASIEAVAGEAKGVKHGSSRATDSGHEYPFFTHVDCPYFPCHEGVDPKEFNCLFCYCPLYALGPRCGGRFRYSKSGAKDCTNCSLPHEGDAGTLLVKEKFALVKELASSK